MNVDKLWLIRLSDTRAPHPRYQCVNASPNLWRVGAKVS
ncbi:MAG: hypothetical protein RL291_721 [Pseudomonadota bacterium]